MVAGIENPARSEEARRTPRKLEAEERVRQISLLGVDVRWEKLRSDPRTVRILEELDLPVGTG